MWPGCPSGKKTIPDALAIRHIAALTMFALANLILADRLFNKKRAEKRAEISFPVGLGEKESKKFAIEG